MKITRGNVLRSLTIVFFSCFLFSCVGVRRMQENVVNSRDTEHKAFVEKKDGEIIEANEAKLKSPLFGKSSIELDGDVKIPLKEIAAYQNNYGYYHSTPNGFAPRIKKGLLNVYLATYTYTTFEPATNGSSGGAKSRTAYVYYLQNGNKGEIESMTPERVENFVSKYAPAMEFIDTYKETQRKVSRWSIINTASVFGGLLIAGTVGVKSNAAAAGGGILFLGGLVNGFVNKVRKAKNMSNIELAIDAYNGQVTKKKKG